jgi:hypothetical protein
MKRNLLITLPIAIIFSLILGSFSFTLLQANNYKAMTDNPVLFTPSYQEKVLKDLNKPNTIKETKELASRIILKNINESNSINDLLQSRLKNGAEDLILLKRVFFLLFLCIATLTVGIYFRLKKN